MTQKELLQKYIDQESNNLFIYSANYLMSTPKPGCEDDWKEAKERVAGLERIQMFLEIQETVNETAPALEQQERLTDDLYFKAIARFMAARHFNLVDTSELKGMTPEELWEYLDPRNIGKGEHKEECAV